MKKIIVFSAIICFIVIAAISGISKIIDKSKTEFKESKLIKEEMKNEINIGDYIQVMECRPLSKILHHVVVKKIRSGEVKEGQK